MNSSVRLAGAAALCAAVLLSACAKKTDETTTTQSSTSQTTAATPAAATADTSATTAAVATVAPADTTAAAAPNAASNGASNGFIDMPVYPGAAEAKEQGMTLSQNGGSFSVKVYNTKDDAKHVYDWYKSHLPAAWKGGVLTANDKTVGTLSNEMADGDQSVVIANDDKGMTRIQVSVKHGK